MGGQILVTGGAGFIGSHLCERLLEEGYEVINLDNFNDYYDPEIKEKNIKKALDYKNYTLYKGDIRDTFILNKIYRTHNIEKVVHLAAMAGVRNSLQDPLEYIDVDVKGTVNLLEFSIKAHIKRFLFASSSSVYGINKRIPFAEKDRVDLQVSPYATAKRAGELYCATYNNLYNLSVGCLRFFTVYGPRQRPEMAIHLFTRLIDEGLPIPVFGDGNSHRDYTYIDDIINGIMAALDIEFSFDIFNLGNSDTIALKDLISVIENKIGKKAIIDRRDAQLGDVPITYADISYSKEKLGYSPRVKIDEGIDRFVNWYRNSR